MAKKTIRREKPARVVDTTENTSISVRKIDNGYIISKSYSKGNTYRSTETFTPKKPTITMPTTKKG